MGLHGKVLVLGGHTGVASGRSCQKCPPCVMEPMPADSKTAPLLAKAEAISKGGNTFGIMHLRSKGERKDDFSRRRSENV